VTARPVVRILINSNGLRIATDDALLALLQRHRERVEVYLQYDGESAQASTITGERTSAGSNSGRWNGFPGQGSSRR